METRIKLRIRDKIKETERAATLVLESLGGPLIYRAGQFLTLIFNNLGPKAFRRSYSFSSTPGVDAFPTITVKKVPNGSASRFLVDQVQIGDILEAISPAGQFILPEDDGSPRDIFLIGGGSGITPLFSILKQVLHFEPQSRVTLIVANSNENAIIFRQALLDLIKIFPERLKIIHFLSNTLMPISYLREAENPAEIRLERLSNALVEALILQCLHFDRKNAQFFLCGPKNLMLKASQMLHYLQFGETQVHQEVFDIIEPYRPPKDLYKNSQVFIEFSGKNFLVPVKAGDTILEAAEKAGLALPYSCRSGICTTCIGKCTSGRVEMFTNAGQITTDISNGIVFTCVGYPLTPEVSIKIG
ncbi:MAG: ferredoxin--NADP reductase [Saprospiraceae bacterium]|nr:ferredoxin--NADP reductase [Saprospiraceae bacterium]